MRLFLWFSNTVHYLSRGMEWSWLKWLMKHDRYLSHDHWSSCFPFLKLKKWNFVASLPAIPSDMEKCRQPLTMWSPGSSRVWRGAKLSLLQQLWRNWSIVPLLLPLKSLTAIWNIKQDWKFQCNCANHLDTLHISGQNSTFWTFWTF